MKDNQQEQSVLKYFVLSSGSIEILGNDPKCKSSLLAALSSFGIQVLSDSTQPLSTGVALVASEIATNLGTFTIDQDLEQCESSLYSESPELLASIQAALQRSSLFILGGKIDAASVGKGHV